MSYSVDVNILLYASDRESRFHRAAKDFMENQPTGEGPLCLAWATLMGYLRIATHPSIFALPLSPAEAMENVSMLLSLSHVRVLGEEDGFWEVYRDVASQVLSRGNHVPDSHLASILRQHHIKTLYSNDADFRKYRFLEVKNPLAG